MSERLLSLVDTAAITNEKVSTVRRRIKDGILPSIKLGGRYKVPEQALYMWIQSNTRPAKTQN